MKKQIRFVLIPEIGIEVLLKKFHLFKTSKKIYIGKRMTIVVFCLRKDRSKPN